LTTLNMTASLYQISLLRDKKEEGKRSGWWRWAEEEVLGRGQGRLLRSKAKNGREYAGSLISKKPGKVGLLLWNLGRQGT